MAHSAPRCPRCQDLLAPAADGCLSTCPSCMARYSAPEEERFPPRPEARPAVPGHEVLEVLGRGGMGVVYRARQVGLNRTVALKVILHGELASSDELHRFGREAEAIARLRHPHIVQIFEVGEWRPTEDSAAFPYFAMELCDGGSLEARLQAAPLSPIEAAGLIRALARAVQHAHDQGIVHRDLKPGNILLASDGTAKIADFGLARRLGEPGQTHSGAVLGTPSYMAPEQAQGKARSADARADVYSLGAILYECVTGRPPFKAATSAETLMQVIADEVVPPRRLQPKVPRDLETVCLKCLHKEPGKRYASAADLADDLDRFLGGLPIRARPGGLAERTIKWVRRRPAVAGLLALVIAVTVGGLALVANAWAGAEWERDRAEERRQEAENQRELAREAQDQAEAEAKNAHRLKLQAERATERALKGERAARDAQLESDRQRRRVDEKATEEKKARQLADQARLQTETALNRTRHALAASRVSQAQHALREGNFGLALDLLDRCAPDARHWDWHHLWRAVHGEVLLHDVENWVALSADGKRLAAVRRGKPNAIAILDFATGKEQLVLKGHAARVRCFAFRPDGREIASADLAGQIKLWDAASGKLTHTLAGHKGAVNGLTWLPDGKGLASAGEDGTRLWDATGKGRLLVGHTGSVLAVAASANGRWLASVSLGVAGVAGPKGRPARPGELIIWDRARGSAAHTLRAGFDAEDLTFHPDGSLVRSSTSLTASPDLRVPASGGSIEIIDPETGKVQRTLRGVSRSGVFRVACSPDGRRLACLAHTGDMPVTLKTFDYRTGKQLTDFPALEHREGPLLFTPDGRFVVHLYQGLRLMDLRGEPDHLVLRGAHRGGAQTLAFAPDGRRLYSGGRDGLVQVWDTVTGLRLETLFAEPAGVAGLAVSPNGKVLATCSESNLGRTGSLRLWDATTGKLLHNLQGFHGGVGCVAFTTDGKGLISGGGTIDKGEINLWEVATGKRVRTISAHKGSVIRVVPSPDGVRLASVAILQPDVKIWNLRTGMELGSLRSLAPAMGLAYHPSGLFLAVASSPSIVDRRGEIKIWDLRFPREFHVLAGHHAQACAVAFSPDGVRLASGALDGGVYTWDTLNGQEVLRLDPGRRVPSTNELDRGTTWAVAFSPGGQVLAAAGGDGRIRLWKGQRGREEVHLRYRTGRSIWFAARTGSWIQAVRDEDGAVRIWDARTGRTILAIQPDATGQSAVSYALDADRLAVRRNGALEVYDTASGKLLQTLPPPPRGEQPWYLTLSADAERLATVNVLFEGPQASGLRIRVRDLRTGKELSNHTGPLEWATGLDLNADLTRLSYSGAKGERLGWDLTAGKAAPPAAGRTVEVVWKAEGRVVHEERFGAGFAKGVRVLDARTTEDDRTFRAALVRFDDTWHSVEAEETAEAEEWAVAAWHLRRLADAIRAGEHEAAVMAWGQYAYAARMTEGEAAYRRTCTELLRRFGETMDPRVANVVAWTCVLAPDAVPNPTVPRRLAELAVARDGKNASWLGTLGLALYRCGEHKAAVGRLEEAVKLEEKRKPPGGLFPTLAVAGAPEDHFVLAMAHARLGNRKVAEDWLRKGQAMADDRVKNPLRVMLGQAASWQRRVEWRWLREEAERTIKGMKP